MLTTILELLATVSMAVSAVQAYLIVNKLWSRKHDKAVAEAQSIASNLLGLLTGFPWVLKFTLDGETKQALVSALWFCLTLFFTLVGLGFWVPSEKKRGLWAKLKAALRLERQEAGELARAFFRPRDAALILRILRQLALIDRHLDPRERQLIEQFARSWGVASPFEGAEPTGGAGAEGYVALRASVAEYLALRPSSEQVAQLREVLAALAGIDDNVSDDETLILQEIAGMLDAHVKKDGAETAHKVVVVPQSADQEAALRDLLQGPEQIAFRGGSAYLAGRYFSGRYARMIRDKYQALGFFTVTE